MSYLLTEKKIKELNERMKFLVNEEIPSLNASIAEARAFGDLSENAEYHSGRENLGKAKAELSRIEDYLRDYTVLKLKTNCKKVEVGSSLELLNVTTNKQSKITIVGTLETDPLQGYISNVCDLGKELIGKVKDEEFELLVNNKVIEYKIIKIY